MKTEHTQLFIREGEKVKRFLGANEFFELDDKTGFQIVGFYSDLPEGVVSESFIKETKGFKYFITLYLEENSQIFGRINLVKKDEKKGYIISSNGEAPATNAKNFYLDADDQLFWNGYKVVQGDKEVELKSFLKKAIIYHSLKKRLLVKLVDRWRRAQAFLRVKSFNTFTQAPFTKKSLFVRFDASKNKNTMISRYEFDQIRDPFLGIVYLPLTWIFYGSILSLFLINFVPQLKSSVLWLQENSIQSKLILVVLLFSAEYYARFHLKEIKKLKENKGLLFHSLIRLHYPGSVRKKFKFKL